MNISYTEFHTALARLEAAIAPTDYLAGSRVVFGLIESGQASPRLLVELAWLTYKENVDITAELDIVRRVMIRKIAAQYKNGLAFRV